MDFSSVFMETGIDVNAFFFCMFTCLFACLFVCLFVCLFTCLFTCLFVVTEHEGEVTVVDISEDGLKVLAGTTAVS